MSEANHSERRQHVRVPGKLVFTLTALPTEEEVGEAIASVLAQTVESAPESGDAETDTAQGRLLSAIETMTLVMNDLGRRIEALIAAQESGRRRVTRRHTLVDLSGGGFCYEADEAPRIGEHFLASIEVSRLSALAVRCVVGVAWVSRIEISEPDQAGAPRSRYQIGMGIEQILESERERLIRTVFKIQRETLRARRDAPPNASRY